MWGTGRDRRVAHICYAAEDFKPAVTGLCHHAVALEIGCDQRDVFLGGTMSCNASDSCSGASRASCLSERSNRRHPIEGRASHLGGCPRVSNIPAEHAL